MKMTLEEFTDKVEWEGGLEDFHSWMSLQSITIEDKPMLTQRLGRLGRALDAVRELLPE